MQSGPENLQVGDLLVFGHLTAHKFKQYPTVKANASGAVPVGFTRTAEYPTLVAPWMHGEPHQSIDEILACLLIGTPPSCHSALNPALETGFHSHCLVPDAWPLTAP